MSTMKHILRKLHIGGGGGGGGGDGMGEHHHHNHPHHRLQPSEPSPAAIAKQPSVASSLPSPPVSSSSSSLGSRAVDAESPAAAATPVSFFEEEYQVQLALAISASDPDGLQDPDSVQIKAAQRMSLGCSAAKPAGGGDGDVAGSGMESLSLRYWGNNVVNYDEKLLDGFYDVYGALSTFKSQGKLPSLVEFQQASVSDNLDYEVIIVNRTRDPSLRKLERRALCMFSDSKAAELGPIESGLVQKVADLVVSSMGGPVADADDMLRRWTCRSYELRASLNNIVLPLGLLDVGLSRHRALLFKVLADQINLPCRLVKGSYYTGTDEGAVNLIKVDCDSEFIVDLMGAPGALIPAEIPSEHLHYSGPSLLNFNTTEQAVKDLCLALDKITCQAENKSDIPGCYADTSLETADLHHPINESKVCPIVAVDGVSLGTRILGNDLKVLPLFDRQGGRSDFVDALVPAQQMKGDEFSCFRNNIEEPVFDKKHHAVPLDGVASSPSTLNKSLSPSEGLGKDFYYDQRTTNEEACTPALNLQHHLLPLVGVAPSHEDGKKTLLARIMTKQDDEMENNLLQLGSNSSVAREALLPIGIHVAEISYDNVNCATVPVAVVHSKTDPILEEVAEWETPWEDLQIGERIGLGSCGEVYRADWNGTEVAVKKFLGQDLSGDALKQFKAEVKIMLRLRHPYVVLFMGAVARPPNLAILTEYLPRGSLYKLLHRPNIQIDERRRLKMALDVARGMNYLHSSHPTIVHRDLKSPNLLVDKNWVVKVCDFGLSRLKHHTFLSSKSSSGTPEWMAPEVLRNELSNEKCDIYSFGVILWELATLRMPWSGLNPMQVVGAVGFQNRRLDIPPDVHPLVAQIISDCWQSDQTLRPSFSQLLSPLKKLQRLLVPTD